MAAEQSAGAGDALGLESAEGAGQGVDAGEMGAVGAGAGRDFRMAVDEQRDIAALNDGRDRLGAVDQRAFVVGCEAKQHRGDVAGLQCRTEVARKRRSIAKLRRD
jgi:hypothetical protein